MRFTHNSVLTASAGEKGAHYALAVCLLSDLILSSGASRCAECLGDARLERAAHSQLAADERFATNGAQRPLHTLQRHSLRDSRRSTPVRGTPRTAHSLSAPARLAVGSRDAATCMSRVPGETSPHRACAALSTSALRAPCGARCRWEGRCGEQITFLRKRCILLSLGTSRPCRGVDAYKIPPLTESPRRGSVRLARCHPKPSKWTTTISSQRAGLLCRGS